MVRFPHMRTASSLNVLALSGLFVSIFLPLALYAQTAPIKPLIPGPVGAGGDIPQGLVSCFDYYRFGSTPVSITSSLTQTSQGEQISFAGEVRNDNPHPVIGASVYVKILRMRTNGAKDANGPDVVDWFTAIGPITLKAGEIAPVSFSWNVPPNARPGEYAAAVYVAASERFNTFGLSFTDDVVGSMARFLVTGSGTEPLSFDKTSIMVGDQQFRFAAFPPRVGGKEPVEVRARVVNNSSASKRFSVTWKLYSWDGLRTDRLLDERTMESEAVAGPGIELS